MSAISTEKYVPQRVLQASEVMLALQSGDDEPRAGENGVHCKKGLYGCGWHCADYYGGSGVCCMCGAQVHEEFDDGT